MQQSRRPASFLASVTNESEARLCVLLGVDIIDAKNPAEGALGALPPEAVRAIRDGTPAHIPVSATIGDPTDNAETVARAVERMAATGIDIVKVGLKPGGAAEETLRRLRRSALSGVRLVGVLIVDCGLAFELIGRMREAHFAGVMLDTGDKSRGALPDLVPENALNAFVQAAHGAGMFAGFAGSLGAEHVPHLLSFAPDVLGFRGGLCRQGQRAAEIDAEGVHAVRRAIPRNEQIGIAPCRAPLLSGIAPWQPEGAL